MDKNRIYQFLAIIPKGKVVSYKTIANKFHIHPRTVGIIMKQNKEPDRYPCYKVLSENCNLGGYSGIGGCNEKIKRLEKDGIEVKGNKVDKKYFWK